MNVQVNQNERLIRPSDPAIRYTGRIDNSNPDAPFLIYVCSQVEFRVTGHVLRVFIENIHSFYENRLGVIINGVESAVLLESGAQVIDLSDRMTDGENHVLLFKRQDCCHALVLHGFAVAEDAELLPLPPRPKRRMEVYGDSVSAGEVSEAEFACGQVDPEGHNGRYSNGYLSYSWQTARLLGAELHDIATGGMALEDGTGYFYSPDYIGMLSSWDKINYYPPFGAKPNGISAATRRMSSLLRLGRTTRTRSISWRRTTTVTPRSTGGAPTRGGFARFGRSIRTRKSS